MPSFPFTNKTLVLAVKNYANTDIKMFLLCPILLDFFTMFKMYYPRQYTAADYTVFLGNFKNWAEIFKIFFLTFMCLFPVIVRFSTNNKRHFLTYMLTPVSNDNIHNSTFLCFNLPCLPKRMVIPLIIKTEKSFK